MHVEAKDGVVVLQPKGFLTGGKETDEVIHAVRSAIHEGKHIVLDLCDTEHLTSIPIGLLVGLHISAGQRGVEFVLCNLAKRIKSVIVLFRLNEVFKIYESRSDALDALRVA